MVAAASSFSVNVAHRRRLLSLALLFATGGALFWWLQALASSPEGAQAVAGSAAGEAAEAVITVSQLVSLGQAEISTAQEAYFSSGQWKRDRDELGLHLGSAKELSLEGYRRATERSLQRYFDPLPTWADAALSHLSIVGSPDPLLPASKELYTTSHKLELPAQFKGWSELNPDYSVRFLNDAALERWVGETFPDGDFQREWRMLSDMAGMTEKERKVLKADLFRYLVLLDRGGVYADVDTASVRPIEQWGSNHRTLTTPLQALLPALVTLPTSSPLDVLRAASGTDQPPALIVALESDAPRSGDMSKWREQSFSRGVQIVQWSLLSRTAGHPVLLDASARAFDQLRDMRKQGEKKREKTSVLDLTGPGLFTDSVFRYLLARYGVTPRQVSGHDHPVRVGDVIILPHRAMQADISERASGEQDVVWHGFSGRWKEID